MNSASARLKNYAEAKLGERHKKVISTLRRASKDCQDADNIHDLRVAIRRFTQALRVFRDLLDRGRLRKMRRRLKIIMDLCGAVRDCDVALAVLRAARVPAAAPAYKRVRKIRCRTARDLARLLSPSRAAKIEKWTDWLKAKPSRSETLRSVARRSLALLAAQFFQARRVAAKPAASEREMHRFRLAAKRLRYTMEIFGPLAGPQWKRQIEEIRGLQEHLGAANDCVVARELTNHSHAALQALLRQRIAAFRQFVESHFSTAVEHAWLARLRKI
ncbi:MAG TPA: CHAD domain-containing protein [Bryobacteraceae bacterium]|nr:CHAD domain-containing protein [Bryobacteraceae bacterium]